MKVRDRTIPKRAVLNVGRDAEYTYWSLEYDLANRILEKRREQIKMRIFLEYGFESKFNWDYKNYQTRREAADLIKQDLDWYSSNDIEVKLNFNPDPEEEKV